MAPGCIGVPQCFPNQLSLRLTDHRIQSRLTDIRSRQGAIHLPISADGEHVLVRFRCGYDPIRQLLGSFDNGVSCLLILGADENGCSLNAFLDPLQTIALGTFR